MQSVPCSCAPTFPSCHLWLPSGPTRAVLTHWGGKSLAWQQNKKTGSCQQSLGNFRDKAKDGVRPCRWDHRDTTGAICYLRPRGPLKPRASPAGDSSGGLPGQKGEMGSCKGESQRGGCSGGQESSSPCRDRGHLGAIGTYTGWLFPPHFFPFTVTWTSCSPPASSEMMTVKITFDCKYCFSGHWQWTCTNLLIIQHACAFSLC